MTKNELKHIKLRYNFPRGVKVCPAHDNDQTFNWNPKRMCVYKSAITAGLIFHVHPFIVRLLAKIRAHLCQLYTSAWTIIIISIVRCHQLGIPLSTTIFMSIFMLKNSSLVRPWWVQINHRPDVDDIVNLLSLPNSNHGLNKKILVVEWEDSDWGDLLKTTFSNVSDQLDQVLKLNNFECYARDALIREKGQNHFQHIINERQLVETSLSFLSLEAVDALDEDAAKNGIKPMKRMIKQAEDGSSRLPSKIPAFLESLLLERGGSRNLTGTI
ncbi:uncharacterized protein LOC141680014 [Apium graveolens]|uniref:uncharacterized protein LOC141680014 n=1 Tax=Apium graveolens TaxID=4045 RepID=UPI003D79D492